MDFALIIHQMPASIWLLMLFAFITPVFKTAWFKGKSGEFFVNLGSSFFLDKNKYHIVSNVTLPTENGSTQIDHIIVSKYGVFVVETKNMKGWIFGDSYQKTWTQKIYKHTNKFQNPLFQNHKHVKVLQSLLQLEDNQIFSVVVFPGECTFKNKMPENVTYPGGYIRYVKSKTLIVLSDYEVNDITNKIESDRLTPSLKTNREHIKHVKSLTAAKDNLANCPKCGSSMVLRQAQNGQYSGKNFWGCSRYPKCRGIINV